MTGDWQEGYDLADEAWGWPQMDEASWIARVIQHDWERLALIEHGESEARVR